MPSRYNTYVGQKISQGVSSKPEPGKSGKVSMKTCSYPMPTGGAVKGWYTVGGKRVKQYAQDKGLS